MKKIVLFIYFFLNIASIKFTLHSMKILEDEIEKFSEKFKKELNQFYFREKKDNLLENILNKEGIQTDPDKIFFQEDRKNSNNTKNKMLKTAYSHIANKKNSKNSNQLKRLSMLLKAGLVLENKDDDKISKQENKLIMNKTLEAINFIKDNTASKEHVVGYIAALLDDKNMHTPLSHARNTDGLTILHCAVQKGLTGVVEKFIEASKTNNNSIYLNTVSFDNETPLQLAIRLGKKDIALQLCQNNAYIPKIITVHSKEGISINKREGNLAKQETLEKINAIPDSPLQHNLTLLKQALIRLKAKLSILAQKLQELSIKLQG